ncbi:hypothetical protein [Prescottella agglutinans]|uniref:hypothetical protein n=1 Tax=Prescottella agglutinans TaxID=1644129 RepID=UPI0024759244|nr:hypothetical protein [Prescottella agglutinans]
MIIDLRVLESHLAGTKVLEVMLKGHLWLESLLNKTLELTFTDPSAFDLDRAQFAQKVNLAQALGLIDSGEAASIRLVNKLRNRLAHELSGEPTLNELERLESSLVGVHKTAFEKMVREKFLPGLTPSAEPHVERLRFFFYIYVMSLAYKVHIQKFEREYAVQLQTYRLIKELEKQANLTPTPDEELRAQHGVPPHPTPLDAWGRGDLADSA